MVYLAKLVTPDMLLLLSNLDKYSCLFKTETFFLLERSDEAPLMVP